MAGLSFPTYLLVGGPRDGETLSIREGEHTIRLPERIKLSARYRPPAYVERNDPVYVRMSLHGEKQVFDVFAKQGMTGDEVLRSLIRGYKPW